MDVFLPVSTELDLDKPIKYYFKVRPKFKYIDICSIINRYHRKKLKLRQLKTKLKKLHPTRKTNVFEEDRMAIISNELRTFLAKILVMLIDKLISLFPLNMVAA